MLAMALPHRMMAASACLLPSRRLAAARRGPLPFGGRSASFGTPRRRDLVTLDSPSIFEPTRPSPARWTARSGRHFTTRGFTQQASSRGQSARAATTTGTTALGLPEGEAPSWEVRMLFDGDCPLCMREVDMLRRMDEGKGRIDFVDIAAPDYDPSKNMGLEFETVMATIHAILPDGTVITGVEVFRRLYEAVGLGWVYAVTKNPTVGALAERVYNFWARYRMQITGRPALEVVLSEKKTCRDVSSNNRRTPK